jgi:hypothetical protein
MALSYCKIMQYVICLFVCLFDGAYAIFNNISVQKTTDMSQGTGKLYHIMLYNPLWRRFELTTVVICTDRIGSCKFNYHTITAAPAVFGVVYHDVLLWRIQVCDYYMK